MVTMHILSSFESLCGIFCSLLRLELKLQSFCSMKSFKLFMINALTLIVGLGLMSGSFSSQDASASGSENVPKIQVQKLSSYRGQYLTVYYGYGTRPFLNSDVQALKLNEIKETRTSYIAGDYVDLPTLQLAKDGVRLGYNLAVFVVSREPRFDWSNLVARQNASLIQAYTKGEIEALKTGQGLEDGLILTLQ